MATPSGIILSIDEIDNEKTDTFAPFLFEKTTTEEFLNQITFEGMEYLQKALKALCLKYADTFSDKLAPISARLRPIVIDADRKRWEVVFNHYEKRLKFKKPSMR